MKRVFSFAFPIFLFLGLALQLGAQSVGQRVQAAAGGASVRDPSLATILFSQDGGVHGTVTSGPVFATAAEFAGNWLQIRWDSQPPNQAGTLGWSAQSVISLAPSGGDVPQPNFSTTYYTTANIFWQNGFAPFSTNPPNPQLGSALGNCTWYAHGRLRELGYDTTQLEKLSGDASLWGEEAQANSIAFDNTPTVGSIAQTDNGAEGLGQVAVVESVNADGTITVTESGINTGSTSTWNFLWRHRTVSPAWFQRFIHVPLDPQAQTTSFCPGCGAPTPDITNRIAMAYNAEGRSVLGDPTSSVGTFTDSFYSTPVSGYYQDFSGTSSRAIIDYIAGDSTAYSVKLGFLQLLYSTDQDTGQLVYRLMVAPSANEAMASSLSSAGTTYNWQLFRKGKLYYFNNSPIGLTALTYTWGYFADRYDLEGGPTGRLGLPIQEPKLSSSAGTYSVWYQLFEKGYILALDIPTLGQALTTASFKSSNVFSIDPWQDSPVGWKWLNRGY